MDTREAGRLGGGKRTAAQVTAAEQNLARGRGAKSEETRARMRAAWLLRREREKLYREQNSEPAK